MLQSGVHRNASQPRIKLARTTERIRFFHCCHKGVVGKVFSKLAVSHITVADTRQFVDVSIVGLCPKISCKVHLKNAFFNLMMPFREKVAPQQRIFFVSISINHYISLLKATFLFCQ